MHMRIRKFYKIFLQFLQQVSAKIDLAFHMKSMDGADMINPNKNYDHESDF